MKNLQFPTEVKGYFHVSKWPIRQSVTQGSQVTELTGYTEGKTYVRSEPKLYSKKAAKKAQAAYNKMQAAKSAAPLTASERRLLRRYANMQMFEARKFASQLQSESL